MSEKTLKKILAIEVAVFLLLVGFLTLFTIAKGEPEQGNYLADGTYYFGWGKLEIKSGVKTYYLGYPTFFDDVDDCYYPSEYGIQPSITDYKYGVTRSAFQVYFKDKSNSPNFIKVVYKNYTIFYTVKSPSPLSTSAWVCGNYIYYNSTWSNVDLYYRVGDNALKCYIKLKQPVANHNFTIQQMIAGLAPAKRTIGGNSEITYTTEQGTTHFVVPKLFMVNSVRERNNNVSLELVKAAANKYNFKVNITDAYNETGVYVGSDFLNNTTAYPVIIDPTVYLTTNIGDADTPTDYIMESNTTYVVCGNIYIYGNLTIQPNVTVRFDDSTSLRAKGVDKYHNRWIKAIGESKANKNIIVETNVSGSKTGIIYLDEVNITTSIFKYCTFRNFEYIHPESHPAAVSKEEVLPLLRVEDCYFFNNTHCLYINRFVNVLVANNTFEKSEQCDAYIYPSTAEKLLNTTLVFINNRFLNVTTINSACFYVGDRPDNVTLCLYNNYFYQTYSGVMGVYFEKAVKNFICQYNTFCWNTSSKIFYFYRITGKVRMFYNNFYSIGDVTPIIVYSGGAYKEDRKWKNFWVDADLRLDYFNGSSDKHIIYMDGDDYSAESSYVYDKIGYYPVKWRELYLLNYYEFKPRAVIIADLTQRIRVNWTDNISVESNELLCLLDDLNIVIQPNVRTLAVESDGELYFRNAFESVTELFSIVSGREFLLRPSLIAPSDVLPKLVKVSPLTVRSLKGSPIKVKIKSGGYLDITNTGLKNADLEKEIAIEFKGKGLIRNATFSLIDAFKIYTQNVTIENTTIENTREMTKGGIIIENVHKIEEYAPKLDNVQLNNLGYGIQILNSLNPSISNITINNCALSPLAIVNSIANITNTFINNTVSTVIHIEGSNLTVENLTSKNAQRELLRSYNSTITFRNSSLSSVEGEVLEKSRIKTYSTNFDIEKINFKDNFSSLERYWYLIVMVYDNFGQLLLNQSVTINGNLVSASGPAYDRCLQDIKVLGLNRTSVVISAIQTVEALSTTIKVYMNRDRIIRFGNYTTTAVSLKKGWNLFGFDGALMRQYSAKEILEYIGRDSAIVRKTIKGNYETYIFTADGKFIGKNFSVDDDYGYYIYSKQNTSFGVNIMPREVTETTLMKGWNLVAIPYENYTGRDVLNWMGSNVVEAITHRKADGTYETITIYDNRDFVVKKNEGVLIKCIKESLWEKNWIGS